AIGRRNAGTPPSGKSRLYPAPALRACCRADLSRVPRMPRWLCQPRHAGRAWYYPFTLAPGSDPRHESRVALLGSTDELAAILDRPAHGTVNAAREALGVRLRTGIERCADVHRSRQTRGCQHAKPEMGGHARLVRPVYATVVVADGHGDHRHAHAVQQPEEARVKRAGQPLRAGGACGKD